MSQEKHDIPAGTTFLGQFVDHDITFDEVSQLGVPRRHRRRRQTRDSRG